MLRRITIYQVVVGALALLLAVVVCGNSFGTPITDIKPEVYFAPGEMLGRYLTSWTGSPYLGFPNFNVGLGPVVAVLAPGAALGLSPEALFKVFHLALWLVAAWGAKRALLALAPNTGQWAGLVAATLYVANPYAVVGGSTLAILLPYAFLPWFVLTLVRAVQNPRSWRWPAAFGLSFFAMSGMNVAVVPIFQLLIVPPVAVIVGRSAGQSWRELVRVLSRCALFLVGVSLYWLVPAISATSTGLQVAAQSERIDGIARVSSMIEVLRGMGMWSIYGYGSEGPWVPEFAPYLANPLIVVVTLAWPVLALLALVGAPTVLRRVGVWTIGLTSVVLVGFFPGKSHTPVSWLVDRTFELLPPLVAFRTTNKAGAVLALMFAMLLGHALPHWLTALRARRFRTVPVSAAALAVVAGWTFPALTGDLYTSPIEVPHYWVQAANSVDQQSHDSRVLFLPNQIRSDYRWTDERPDDISNSLMQREAIVPESAPNASPPGANFLAALGDLVASAGASPNTISTMARYLGAGDILLRHDTRWEDAAGVRPAALAAAAAADPGLLGLANFGKPGQNVVGPAGGSGFESILPPVQHYGVKEAISTVSARPTSDSITVAGDAWAFDSLARTARVTSTPVVWFAHDTTAQKLAAGLGPQHRMVITDTNRRQAAIPNRLTAGYGPLLSDTAPLPSPTRALGEADDQTVLHRTGPTVTASQVGSAFFDTPYGQPDNVLDGDDSTSWLFGDFDRAVGVTLQVGWTSPQTLGRISIRPTALGPVHIDSVTLSAGGVLRTVRLPDTGTAEVDLGGVVAKRLDLRVDGTRGQGFSSVGIAELGLPGPKVERVARTPVTFDNLYDELDQADRTRFDRTPLDVSFTRSANGAGTFDDSETRILRDFTIPTTRNFASAAMVRMLDRSDAAFDWLSGGTRAIVATSSGTYFDNPDIRASMASDGDPGTAWIPGGEIIGAWWQIEGPKRSLDSIIVAQRTSTRTAPARTASRVQIEVDGKVVTTATIRPGRTEIALPTGTAGGTVRVVILDVEGPADGLPPQFTTIDAQALTANGSKGICTTVAEVDGQPLRMRPVDLAAVSRSGETATPWQGCSDLLLGEGEHSLRPVDGMALDGLDLTDRAEPSQSAGKTIDLVSGVDGSDVDQVIKVAASEDPVTLKIGQSWDPRWHATIDGVDLGTPVRVDGWSTGWVLPPGVARSVHVQFGPQRAASLALWASSLFVVVALWLCSWGARRRWARAAQTTAASDKHAISPESDWRLPAWAVAGLAIVLAVVSYGLAGLIGAGAALALRRIPAFSAEVGVVVGSGFVALGGLVQVLLTQDSWGKVDAAGPSSSMVPHWLAVVGVVVALVSAQHIAKRRNTAEGDLDVGS